MTPAMTPAMTARINSGIQPFHNLAILRKVTALGGVDKEFAAGYILDLRASGVTVMPTPPSYYEMLPERIAKSGIGKIDEDIAVLQELEVLIDGSPRFSLQRVSEARRRQIQTMRQYLAAWFARGC